MMLGSNNILIVRTVAEGHDLGSGADFIRTEGMRGGARRDLFLCGPQDGMYYTRPVLWAVHAFRFPLILCEREAGQAALPNSYFLLCFTLFFGLYTEFGIHPIQHSDAVTPVLQKGSGIPLQLALVKQSQYKNRGITQPVDFRITRSPVMFCYPRNFICNPNF